ncbi:MAG TPA: Ig-like domain repeat protein [Granulicella sp.]|jgi:subtilase family serine protease|nr:Ig-like domain repeat protein [Granulicella sp.]
MLHRSGFVAALLFCLTFCSAVVAQSPASRVLVPVDDRNPVILKGNTHPLARAAFDQGAIAEETPLQRMQLVLARSPEQEAGLKQLIDRQQDRGSSSYHQWLTPQSFGAAFGPSDRDLSAVTVWLASQGFTGIHVNPGRTVVEFSGTAGNVQTAFHTPMHHYLFHGQQFVANARDPQIPAALAPVIAGIASLNNFSLAQATPASASQNLSRNNSTGVIARSNTELAAGRSSSSLPEAVAAVAAPRPEYTTTSAGKTVYAVTPYDFAAIYNVAPLWSNSIDGTGQTIAVAGDSDIDAADFVSFRTLFGLPIGATGSATHTQYLNLIFNGPDPGSNADEVKGAADTQWSGAIAKNATIDYVISETTSVSQGSDLSAQYIVDNNLASVLVDSYSTCERSAGAAYNSFINNLWQQAAAQGITAVVAAGDNGSAGCDAVSTGAASGGLAVNAVASTPYNVAVGGTDFYMPNGGASYWNATNDSTTQASAKGYVPETTWNDSCTNANYAAISPYTGETPEQVCNNSNAATAGLVTVRGGSGGASSCAQSSGTSCSSGYAKPSWQTGAGVPTDGVRDLPDVSLFAGDGAFGSLYFLCQKDANPSGSGCALGTPNTDFVGAGGTSFAAAAFAGIIALVNQKAGSPQGNVNYTLYALAAQQQKAGTACTATGSPASSCIFNDITTNTNAMPCAAGSTNCATSQAGDTYGVLSGYSSTAGYDRTTGLGSVNAANLVNGWQNVTYRSTTTTLTLNNSSGMLTIVHGTPVIAAGDVTASSGSGTPTGQVAINAAAANGSIGSVPLSGGVFTGTFTTFPGSGKDSSGNPQSYQVHAVYSGDGTFAASESVPVNLTVTPEDSTTTVTVLNRLNNQPVTNVPYGGILAVQATVAGVSKQGNATGNVNVTDNGQVLYGGTYRLNSSGYADVQTTSLGVGSHSFVAAYSGDLSFNPSTSSPYALTIVKAPTTASVASSATTPITDNLTVTFTITIGTTGYGFAAPSGVVTLTASNGQALGSAHLTGKTGGGSYDSSIAYITIPAATITSGNTVTVNYPGDANYLPSSSATGPITITATKLPTTTTTVQVTPNPVGPKGSITLSATVAPTSGTPFTGTVSFLIDGQQVGTPTPMSAAGVATPESVSIATFAIGPHIVTAVFSGDAGHKSSVGTVSFIISSATGSTQPAIAVTVNPQTSVQGTAVMVQVAVTSTTPGTPTPTGTLQLLIDGSFNGSPVTVDAKGAGSFTLVTSVLQPGPHNAAVFYSGDSTYAPSYSNPTPFTITAAGSTPTTVTLTGVPAQVGVGSTFPFAASIAPASPAPTGTLEIIVDGGTPQPQQPLQADPQNLSLDTTGLGLGPHTVSVYYSGNTNLSAATSPAVSFNIIPQNSAFTLSPTTASAHFPLASASSNPITFTVRPTVGGAFSVSFACTSGLPAGMNCSFSPATVNLNGLASSTTVLTVVVGNVAANRTSRFRGDWYTLGGGVSFAGVLLLLLPRRNRRLASLLTLLTVFALGAISGCGSGIAPEQGPFPVTVTATSTVSVMGATTQTATVNVTLGGTP